MSVTLYKVGGSLLDLPTLSAKLREVVPADVSPLLVVGGGPTADLVRQWDQVHNIGEERAHWLALRSLQLNEALLAELLPYAEVVRSRDEAVSQWSRGAWPILSAHDFVSAEEPASSLKLPHTWEATSDSVAAWIARRWPVDRLVMLKSVDLPEGATNGRGFTEQAIPNFVDRHFFDLARDVPVVEWINLRGNATRPQRLAGQPNPSLHETAERLTP